MRRYGFVFSLGAACSCSQSLRLANLQFASFPCDWLWGGTPESRARALAGGFDALLDETRLLRHEIPWKLEHEPWREIETGIVFKHDFDWNAPLAETLPAVREKYARRLRRLSERICAAGDVLVVWVNPPGQDGAADSSFVAARRVLESRWPKVRFEFLVTRCEKGRAFAARSDRTQDGIRTVAWDYDDGREAFIDNARMAAFLSGEISTADYRTRDEREAWPARQRALRYAQYNATTWWGYAVNKAWWRLYRRVRKAVERRGLLRLGR